MGNTKEIKLNEMKEGDLLLYRLKEYPEFIEPFFKNISKNFGILVDKLIIFASDPDKNPDTYYTHAALVYSTDESVGGKAAEATMPHCQIRKPIGQSEYSVNVQRVPNGKDGSLVLKQLPALSEENSRENASYALAQATMAALACLLRVKVNKDNKLLNLLLDFLKFLLYPLGKALDGIVEKFEGQEQAWFCSQLASYCYDMTAKVTGDKDFLIKSPSSTKIGDTVLGYLIGQKNFMSSGVEVDLSEYEKLTLDSEELLQAGKALADHIEGKPGLRAAPVLTEKNLDEISTISMKFLEKVLKLFNIELDKGNIEQSIIDFQTAFVMPIDLVNTLEYLGEYNG